MAIIFLHDDVQRSDDRTEFIEPFIPHSLAGNFMLIQFTLDRNSILKPLRKLSLSDTAKGGKIGRGLLFGYKMLQVYFDRFCQWMII